MSASSESAGAEGRVVLPADLHARPAGLVSRLVTQFDAEVELVTETRSARAGSVLAVMGLGASAGTTLTVRASGPQAAEAVAAVTAALMSDEVTTNAG